MEVDLFVLIVSIFEWVRDFLDGSFLFAAIQFFLFIYVAVLLVDIVLLLMLRDISSDLKTTLFGGQRPLASKSKTIKRWEAVSARLESGSPSQYKAAVLEADEIASEILSGIGYKGTNMKEKLDGVKEGQIESKPALVEAHETRNRVISDPNFALTHDEAKETLEKYRRFFEEVELF